MLCSFFLFICGGFFFFFNLWWIFFFFYLWWIFFFVCVVDFCVCVCALFFLRSLPSEVVQNTCVWVCQDYSCRGNHNFGIPHIWINAVYTEALCEYRFSVLCGSGSSKVLMMELLISDRLNSHSWSFKVTPRFWTLLWSCCCMFGSSAGKAYVSAGKLKLWSGSQCQAYFLVPVDFRFVLSPWEARIPVLLFWVLFLKQQGEGRPQVCLCCVSIFLELFQLFVFLDCPVSLLSTWSY